MYLVPCHCCRSGIHNAGTGLFATPATFGFVRCASVNTPALMALGASSAVSVHSVL